MLHGHRLEGASTVTRQAHAGGPAIALDLDPNHQAVFDKAVDDAGDIPVRYHQATRQLGHLQALLSAFQGGHDVEARQRGAVLQSEFLAQLGFDMPGCLEHLQPEAQPQLLRPRQVEAHTSPPESAIA